MISLENKAETGHTFAAIYFQSCVCSYVENNDLAAAVLGVSPVPSSHHQIQRSRPQFNWTVSCINNSSDDGKSIHA